MTLVKNVTLLTKALAIPFSKIVRMQHELTPHFKGKKNKNYK
jgi:hypothetical protein